MRLTAKNHFQLYAFFISIVLSFALFILLKPTVSAATINVVAGTDAIQENNQCQLSEAIQNVNNQDQTNDDCVAGDGNNDTIQLPAGTINLTAGLPALNKSVIVQGQGKGQTIIDGGGQHNGFTSVEPGNPTIAEISIAQLTMRAFKGYAIITNTVIEKLNVNGVEIDGTGSEYEGGSKSGISSFSPTIRLNDVYIHSFSGADNEANNIFGILLWADQNGTINAEVNNVTISNITGTNLRTVSGINLLTGLLDGSFSPGTINLTLNNTTINNINNTGGNTATYLSTGVGVNNGSSTVNVTINNSTLRHMGTPFEGFLSGGLAMTGLALGAEDNATINYQVQNTVFAGFAGKSCDRLADAAPVFELPPSAGTIDLNITSLGGNISDDESCTDFFTQPTDKNNVTTLKDTLNSLTNNGGSLPTILPKPGSPAIDGGVCGQGVPSTDARGVSRPQGKTCDSGAVEVEQAARTGTVVGGKNVALTVPDGVVVKAFGSVSGTVPSDNRGNAEYEFPLGLLSFELGVPQGSANQISLDFESDLDPASVVARKYNAADKTFTTLSNATITRITKDNKPTLRLTYSITDGTFPDLDVQANGTIVDPVGLAVEKKGVLANTGALVILAMPIGLSLLLGAFIVTYLDYRKHKKPLQQADRELAQSYTYWHHLKTVTIPLISYRLSVVFESKKTVG